MPAADHVKVPVHIKIAHGRVVHPVTVCTDGVFLPRATLRRGLIDPTRASTEHRPGDPVRGAARLTVSVPQLTGAPAREPGDTTAIEVVDRDGNLFSATPSSGWSA